MIANIRGLITEIGKHYLIVENHGIGYFVNVMTSFSEKTYINQEIFLYTKQIFKEDDISIFAFETFEQKIWFEHLIKVDGVGAKSAIAILNTFSIQDVENAILNRDDKFFTSISGIGNKIALRIINEMQKVPNKINLEKVSVIFSDLNYSSPTSTKINKIAKKDALVENERELKLEENNIYFKNQTQQEILQGAIEALSVLGFSNSTLYKDIRLILNEFEENFDAKIQNKDIKNLKISSEDLVSFYLKKMNKR